MKKIFICSPYRGDVESNTRLAKKIGRIAALCEYVPVIPHLMYTSFLDDANPEDRMEALPPLENFMPLVAEVAVGERYGELE